MRTEFTAKQREDPGIAISEAILRKCVHCGFCTATCPTYVLLGDELDGPRGRIYLIKDMLEQERPATAEVVRHVDRCLSCLSCMTTCPSGVDYRRLIDQARVHVERTYRRPWLDRSIRALLAWLMPYPARFGAVLGFARLARPLRGLLPARLRAMLDLTPALPASRVQGETHAGSPMVTSPSRAGSMAAAAEPEPEKCASRRRVAVLTGCVQSVIGQSINAATLRLLERAGVEVLPVGGCCGSIVHHLGREEQSLALAGVLVERLIDEIDGAGLDAIVSNASGCGAHLKDFGFVLRDDSMRAGQAAAIAGLVKDVTELLVEVGLPEQSPEFAAGHAPGVAYHAACSMQHGQRLHEPPRRLLREAGFEVFEIADGHLCCGSAGTYNMLQPEISARLAARKLGQIAATGADIVAAGNLGCLTQLDSSAARAGAGRIRFVHTVELLDWATGGPAPAGISCADVQVPA